MPKLPRRRVAVFAAVVAAVLVLRSSALVTCYKCTGYSGDGRCGTPFNSNNDQLNTCRGHSCNLYRTFVSERGFEMFFFNIVSYFYWYSIKQKTIRSGVNCGLSISIVKYDNIWAGFTNSNIINANWRFTHCILFKWRKIFNKHFLPELVKNETRPTLCFFFCRGKKTLRGRQEEAKTVQLGNRPIT